MQTEAKKMGVIRLEGMEQHTVFPMYFLQGEGEIDLEQFQGPISYVMTADGMFVYRESPFSKSLTKTGGLAGLGKTPPMLRFQLPRIPRAKVLQALGFFRWAEQAHRSEAIVLLYVDEHGEIQFLVPTQRVSAGSCDYDFPTDAPQDWTKIGSWHSHGSGSAFHSSVDQHDEEHDDGFHLTSGHVLSDKMSISTSMTVDGTRFMLQAQDAMEANLSERDDHGYTAATKGPKVVKKIEATDVAKESLAFPEEWKTQLSKAIFQGRDLDWGWGIGADGWSSKKTKKSSSERCTQYMCVYNAETTDLKLWDAADKLSPAIRKMLREELELVPNGESVDFAELNYEALEKLQDALEKKAVTFGQLLTVAMYVKHRNVRKKLKRGRTSCMRIGECQFCTRPLAILSKNDWKEKARAGNPLT